MFDNLDVIQTAFNLWCIVFGYFMGSFFAGRRSANADATELDTSSYPVGEYAIDQTVREGRRRAS